MLCIIVGTSDIRNGRLHAHPLPQRSRWLSARSEPGHLLPRISHGDARFSPVPQSLLVHPRSQDIERSSINEVMLGD